jgi:hypothetical protein
MLRRSCIATALSTVLAIWCLSGCGSLQRVPRNGSVSGWSELISATSPNGLLDAVLAEHLYGGAAGGGVDSNVYIVLKGAPVYAKGGREVFSADPMNGAQLVWKQDHLLEIHYNVAEIHIFRNLWGLYEVENVGSEGQRDFEVEVRLVPACDFSALTPDGAFRLAETPIVGGQDQCDEKQKQ